MTQPIAPTCTRVIEFDAGHRVMGHENKCAHLHGHRYKVMITARAADLDELGRVIDFGVLKERVGGWIDRMWDHGFLLCSEDTAALEAIGPFYAREGHPQQLFQLPYNPTAENIAHYLLTVVCPRQLARTGVQAIHVRVWETPNCYADARL